MATGESLPEALDVSTYSLDALRDDVRSIVDVGSAISRVTRWALGAAAIAGVAAWLIFGARIDSGFVSFVVAAVSAVLAAPVGAAIGAWRLARERLDVITQAAGKVVDVIGDMHADVTRIRQGHAETSVQKVAVGLVEEAVVPAVFGSATSFAEGLLGPLGFLAEQAAKPAMALVKATVVGAIEALPDRTIGQISTEAIESTEAGASLASALDTVRDDYATISSNLTSTVAGVGRTSLRVALVATVLTVVPLAVWVFFVWAVS